MVHFASWTRILNPANFTSTFLPVTLEKNTVKDSLPAEPSPAPRRVYNEKHINAFLFAIALLLSCLLGAMLFALIRLNIPDISTVAHYRPAQATIIYDRHGGVAERFFSENRTVVGLDAMNPLLPKAFVAAEDGRFYEHPGLDLLSVLRALGNNIIEGRRGQGGSTITQQVARALLLSPEKTYIRKVKEAIRAWRIDSLLTKDEILFIYLNQIYLGESAYGVEAAAQVYFGKTAKNLSLAEAATLAGLPQAPSRYSPLKYPDMAAARQKYVLARMVADGYVDAETARLAHESPVPLKPRPAVVVLANGYYLDVVKRQAGEMLQRPLQELGARIYTHLDQEIQQQAQTAVQAGTKASFGRQALLGKVESATPQAALVCLEKNSGKVLALTGGTDFSASPFNRATQSRRPAGSIFKPFVYAAALKDGWFPQSLITDAPLAIRGGNGRLWQPKNYTGQYHGETTLAIALAHSYNTATVRLMQAIGVKKVHAMARAAGITAKLPPDLSLALGTLDVSLLEITAAYSPFFNNGMHVAPAFIDRIEYNNGKTLRGSGGERRRACDARIAQQMQAMLEGVVRFGTGQRAKGLAGTTAGKTGTSDKSRDAWFVGANGDYLTGVWTGNDHNESLGKLESGGRTATPVWYDFMRAVRQ